MTYLHKIIITGALALFFASLIGLQAGAEAQKDEKPDAIVRQIIDPNAKRRLDVFRFDPLILHVKAGAKVRFVGSTGRHTVSSISRMIPDGAKRFEIRGRPQMDLTFEKEGVYGIRCRVHGHHGMVMLLIVGEPAGNMQAAKDYIPKLREQEQVQFTRLFRMLEQTQQNK